MPTLELIDQVESWLNVLEQANYYELLGILEVADESAIQTAFHEFSLHFHPDRHRGEPEELLAAIVEIYERGAEAYGVLRDPKTRARYDLALSQGALRYIPGQTGSEQNAESMDLVALAQTKAGKLHARQAERALSEGQLEQASVLMQKALLAEGKNDGLSERAAELFDLVKSGRILPNPMPQDDSE